MGIEHNAEIIQCWTKLRIKELKTGNITKVRLNLSSDDLYRWCVTIGDVGYFRANFEFNCEGMGTADRTKESIGRELVLGGIELIC